MSDQEAYASRGEYRPFYERFWTGKDVLELTGDARQALHCLKGLSGTTGLKLWPGLTHQLALFTGRSEAAMKRAVKELIKAEWIEVEGSLVWVIRGLEFEPNILPSNPLHRKHVQRHLANLPRQPMLERFRARYMAFMAPTEPETLTPKGIPKPLPQTLTENLSQTLTPNGRGYPETEAVSGSSKELRVSRLRAKTAQPDLLGGRLADAPPARTPAPAAARQPTSPKYPHFPVELCKRAFDYWHGKLSAAETYPHFRKFLGERLFTAADGARLDDGMRDDELLPVLQLYRGVATASPEAKWISLEHFVRWVPRFVECYRAGENNQERVALAMSEMHTRTVEVPVLYG